MKLVYAKSAKWANRGQTAIDLVARFEEIPEDLPFTANPNDTEAHGRDLFARAVAGEFGPIAEFTAEAPLETDVAEAVRYERDRRIASTDWTQSADVPQSTKDKWAPYRQALRDFPQQPEFPWYSLVVVEEDFGYDLDLSKAPWPVKP
jgi:hypothetical protein